MQNLSIRVANIVFRNPVLVASGTFGYGEEYENFLDLNELGGIITKTITLNKREGNLPPRIVEVTGGILNSIGLENSGIEEFIKNKLPYLEKLNTNIIVSIGGERIEEYLKIVEIINNVSGISAIEINISCPNIRKMKKLFSQTPEETYKLVSKIRKITKIPIFVKLSPNVTEITEIAKSSEDAGADGISLINTLFGMAIDVERKIPKLGNIYGGLSGPAIKPVALYNVWKVYNSVKIPIIGSGGIMNFLDALEFIITGASLIAVGTGNFINPKISSEIIDEMKKYLKEKKIKNIKELVGSLKWKHLKD
jgi:dihydroorotate dehydrogenase (NAD+) catalytic subunit